MSKMVGKLQVFEWSVTYKPEGYSTKPYTGAITAHNYNTEEYYNRRKSFNTYEEAYNWVHDILKRKGL